MPHAVTDTLCHWGSKPVPGIIFSTAELQHVKDILSFKM